MAEYANPFLPEGGGPSFASHIPADEDNEQPEKILREPKVHRFVIAVDYGTTYTGKSFNFVAIFKRLTYTEIGAKSNGYSGVAYATPSGDEAVLEEIDVMDQWGPRMGNHDKIPSVISYSQKSEALEENWGSDLAPNALAMINTKLELDLNTVTEELDLIRQALDAVDNLSFQRIRNHTSERSTWKRPEAIVSDYLTKVFEHLSVVINSFSEVVRRQLRLDLVITIPAANWKYRAKNATFRALTKAGFNKENFPRLSEIILVTEPEAAAIYTARYLKKTNGRDFLKPGECFIVLDAGGGTVDVVTYLVKKVHPSLELETLTIPIGEKSGSVFIDMAFKDWLRSLLGEHRYRELDPDTFGQMNGSYKSEGQNIRKLMAAFIRRKERFRGNDPEIRLTLPEPLDNLNLDGRVVAGEIRIPNEQMKKFFDKSINTILEMVDGQLGQADIEDRTVRHIFLIGGYGESLYLKEQLENSMNLREITLHRPDTSWTAVVRGAVICGIEKSNTLSTKVTMEECQRSYGIAVSEEYSEIKHTHPNDVARNRLTQVNMAEEQMLWLIQKGDVLLSDKPREVKTPVALQFAVNDTASRRGKMPVYGSRDERTPARYRNAKHDMYVALELEYDLFGFPDEEFEEKTSLNSDKYYEAVLLLTMKLDRRRLSCQLSFHDSILATAAAEYPA